MPGNYGLPAQNYFSQLYSGQDQQMQKAMMIAQQMRAEQDAARQAQMDQSQQERWKKQSELDDLVKKSLVEDRKADNLRQEEERKAKEAKTGFDIAENILKEGGTFDEAYSFLKKRAPDIADEVLTGAFQGYARRKKADYQNNPQVGQQGIPQEPMAMPQQGVQQPTTPVPLAQAPWQQAAPYGVGPVQPGMPMPQPGGARPMATPFGGAPVEPSGVMQMPFQQPTREEFLATQSPAFIEAQRIQKDKAETAALIGRAREMSSQAQLQNAEASRLRAEAQQSNANVLKQQFDLRVGSKFADPLAILKAQNELRWKPVLEETIRYHDIMSKIAEKNADTRSAQASKSAAQRASAPTLSILKTMETQAKQAKDDEDRLDTATRAAELKWNEAKAKADRARGDADIAASGGASDAKRWALAAAEASQIEVAAHKAWQDALWQSQEAANARASVDNIRDNMRRQLDAAGIVSYGDGKGAGPVTKVPPIKKPVVSSPSGNPLQSLLGKINKR